MSGFKTSLLVGFALANLGFFAHAENLSTSTIKSGLDGDSSRKWSGEWSLSLGGESFAENKDEGAAATLFIKSTFDYKFAPWLKAHVRPRLDFFSSRLQERYKTDEYQSGLRMSEFILSAKPFEMAEFRAGAISEEFLNSPMLVATSRAFPGLMEIFGTEFSSRDGELKVHFAAQQTIPTSYSLDSEREDKEPLPTFNTQSLHVSGKNFDRLEWKSALGHYNWTGLPDKVAFESAMAGNSVIGEVAPGARFKSGFDGFFAGAEVCFCNINGWAGVVGEFQRIHNDKAGSGLGDAQMWGIGPRLNFKDLTVNVQYRRFFSERDATVAVYSRSFLGNTNRMGDDVEMKLDFLKWKFALVGEWANSVPIRDDNIQHTATSVYIGVESHYAPF